MKWEDYKAHDHDDGKKHGSLKVLRQLRSPQLGNVRDIFIYLPPTYGTAGKRYPVIYMHDGQNLFDPRTSFSGEWHVDETLDDTSEQGVEAIVVGIPNTGATRLNEYSPFNDLRHGEGRADDYLDFIIDTIKPIVDDEFDTDPAVESTGIAGSSMGGLVSLYGFFARSNVFGFSGVMSPSLWYANRAILDYVADADFVGGRIYLDIGTKEGTRHTQDVYDLRDKLMRKGYRLDLDLMCVIERGAEHTESAWARRIRAALEFLV